MSAAAGPGTVARSSIPALGHVNAVPSLYVRRTTQVVKVVGQLRRESECSSGAGLAPQHQQWLPLSPLGRRQGGVPPVSASYSGRGSTPEASRQVEANESRQPPALSPVLTESDDERSHLMALAEQLERQRTLREAGLNFATGMLGAGLSLLALVREGDMVALPVRLQAGCGCIGAAMLLSVILPKLGGDWEVQLGDIVHVECYAGRLYFQPGAKPDTTASTVFNGAVAVRDTGDARGRGAYATIRIPKDSVLTPYDGETLSNVEYYMRYPDGVSDYCMVLDSERVIDAAAISQGSDFTAGHVNHSRTRHNVRRWYSRREGRIWYLSSRDIEAGEEILIDYGKNFWKGREKLEME